MVAPGLAKNIQPISQEKIKDAYEVLNTDPEAYYMLYTSVCYIYLTLFLEKTSVTCMHGSWVLLLSVKMALC